MKRRDIWLLFAAGLLVALTVAALQPVPGYMDAAYYYAGGTQLAAGNGFQEQFIWNFLDQPVALPHPSHAYWYPLASIVAAAGMILTGTINFVTARIGFVLMAALAPLAGTTLAYHITNRRPLALLSGVLAVFSGYYLPFIVTTDNYSLYLLLGALYFLLLENLTLPKAALLGLLAGLLNLARSDGLLWLPLTLLAVTVLTWRTSATPARTRLLSASGRALSSLAGYLLVMGPWMLRNLSTFGTLLPPGSSAVLWMTDYNQLYSYTPGIYTFQSWLATGWKSILSVRLEALLQNLSTAFFAQGMIFLSPLVVVGIWSNRKLFRVQIAVLGWLLLLFAESVLFPFASVSGGFFHAGTTFQPLWLVLAPVGLDVLVVRFTKNKDPQIAALFRITLAIVAILFSGMLVKMRVIDAGWNEGEYLYRQADRFLAEQGASADAVVMTRNPPAYFIMTGRRAVVVPYGDVQTLLAAAQQFDVRYVLLEVDGVDGALADLYAHPENYPDFDYLGMFDEAVLLQLDSSR